MTERSLKRWVALRALHERWGVPLDMIQRATEFSDGALAKRAHSEEWNRNQSTPGIHARLINVFEDQLARLTKGESEGDEEKQAKALSLMAKTLESIALVGSKLAQVSQEHSDPNKGAPDDPTAEYGTSQDGKPLSAADRTSQLDHALAELVGGLVQSRGLE